MMPINIVAIFFFTLMISCGSSILLPHGDSLKRGDISSGDSKEIFYPIDYVAVSPRDLGFFCGVEDTTKCVDERVVTVENKTDNVVRVFDAQVSSVFFHIVNQEDFPVDLEPGEKMVARVRFVWSSYLRSDIMTITTTFNDYEVELMGKWFMNAR